MYICIRVGAHIDGIMFNDNIERKIYDGHICFDLRYLIDDLGNFFLVSYVSKFFEIFKRFLFLNSCIKYFNDYTMTTSNIILIRVCHRIEKVCRSVFHYFDIILIIFSG